MAPCQCFSFGPTVTTSPGMASCSASAADAAYTRAHYEGRLLPPTLVSREDTIRSVERLREVERETGALVVTGHDGREWEGLRKVYE